MARKRRKNIIDVPETRKFLFRAYGLKSREITDYEIEVFHEEFMGIFEWYHTKGTLIVRMKFEDELKYDQLGKKLDGEDVAIALNKFVYRMLDNHPELYRDTSAKLRHKEQLQAIYSKIKTPEVCQQTVIE